MPVIATVRARRFRFLFVSASVLIGGMTAPALAEHHVADLGSTLTAARPAPQRIIAPRRIAGRIHHTLYQAARRAGLNRRLTRRLVHIFAGRVAYRQDIHDGDRFVAICKGTGDGRRLVAAELALNDRTLHAFVYPDGNGKAAWYALNGTPLRPTLLRTPVDYTRVSSPFSTRRLNPILHTYRPHYGVDLAAPTGTPVHAAGDGRVTFRSRKGGYGNLVIIDNAGPYSTRYGHLRRFAKGIHLNSRVHQGEVIGYVGSTGLATGPHLHFEIRVNGKPRPPLDVDLPRERLRGRELYAYEKAISPLANSLDPTPRRPAREAVTAGGYSEEIRTSASAAIFGPTKSLSRFLSPEDHRNSLGLPDLGAALKKAMFVRPDKAGVLSSR